MYIVKKYAVSLIVFITVIIALHFFVTLGKEKYIFYGDALGYYSYLPSLCIHDNMDSIQSLPTNENIDDNIITYFRTTNNTLSPTGYHVNQYTYGVALMELPFFTIAHLQSKIVGSPTHGYSEIYSNWIRISSLFYTLLGLLFTFYSLRKFISLHYAALTTCLILLGSNLFWFAFAQAGMAHIPLFCLFAAILYYTIQLYENPKPKYFYLLAFCIGLVTVIRPSDGICILIPLLYGITNRQSLKKRVDFLRTHAFTILIAVLIAVVPVLPQLLIWKKYTGSFLYYSYNEFGFHWSNPQIIKGLFGGSNGWLLYSPIFIFSVIGLWYKKYFSRILLPIIVIIPLYIYIIYSWYCYNYINGFGSRPMIHIYPLLAVPLGVLLYQISKKNSWYRFMVALPILFFTWYSLRLQYFEAQGRCNSETANFSYIKETLFKNKITAQDLVVLDIEQPQPAKSRLRKIETLGLFNEIDSNNYYFLITKVEYPKPSITTFIKNPSSNKKLWIRASANFNSSQQAYVYDNHLMILELTGEQQCTFWHGVKINNKIGRFESTHQNEKTSLYHNYLNEWGLVEFFVPMPACMASGNQLKLYIWNSQLRELKVRDMRLELWEEEE